MSFDEFAEFAAEREETWVEHPRKKELDSKLKADSVLG